MGRKGRFATAAILLGLGWAGYAGKDEVSLRQGPHGLEAIQISDIEWTISNTFDDGPHLRRTDTGIEASWICAGDVIRRQYGPAPVTIEPICGYDKPIRVRAPVPLDTEIPIPPLGKLVAVSDPHGQYQTLLHLLQANHVIDAQGNWLLGDAQLVMTGDVFDRGHQVTEIFWFLYELEQQAQAAGGRLHFLLGNHEFMVLANDLRYVNGKYLRTADLLDTTYPSLYGADTVIGQWLRSRDTIRQLGDMLFMHAGISVNFFNLNLSIPAANAQFRRSLGLPESAIEADPVLATLHGVDGPIWYRGYFWDETLSQQQVDAIVSKLGVNHVIVGHTSMPTVMPLFNQKVIGIDTSIKKGLRGELLLIDSGNKWRGTYQGERQPL